MKIVFLLFFLFVFYSCDGDNTIPTAPKENNVALPSSDTKAQLYKYNGRWYKVEQTNTSGNVFDVDGRVCSADYVRLVVSNGVFHHYIDGSKKHPNDFDFVGKLIPYILSDDKSYLQRTAMVDDDDFNIYIREVDGKLNSYPPSSRSPEQEENYYYDNFKIGNGYILRTLYYTNKAGNPKKGGGWHVMKLKEVNVSLPFKDTH